MTTLLVNNITQNLLAQPVAGVKEYVVHNLKLAYSAFYLPGRIGGITWNGFFILCVAKW